MNTTRTPLREIVAYLGIAYSLALTVALALPDANINKLLSVMVPTVTVGILTFTLTPTRLPQSSCGGGSGSEEPVSRPGRPRSRFRSCSCAGAYGTAVALGVGRLDVDLANATPSWAIDLVLAALIGTVFIVGEEIGWRGYLLPRMQQLTKTRGAQRS